MRMSQVKCWLLCVQTLRVQSAEGTVRVDMLESDATAQLFDRVHDEFNLSSFAFALFRDRARRDEVVSSKSRRLRDAGLQHGDMLYLTPVNGAVLFEQPTTSAEVRCYCSSCYFKGLMEKPVIWTYSWRRHRFLKFLFLFYITTRLFFKNSINLSTFCFYLVLAECCKL